MLLFIISFSESTLSVSNGSPISLSPNNHITTSSSSQSSDNDDFDDCNDAECKLDLLNI